VTLLQSPALPHQTETAPRKAGGTVFVFLVAVWVFAVAVSLLAILVLDVHWAIPAVIVGSITAPLVLLRPMFGVCLICAMTTLGPGIGVGQVLSLNRALGIVFALGAFGNMLSAGWRLRLTAPPFLAIFAYLMLGLLSIMWARVTWIVQSECFTLFQLSVYVLLIASLVSYEGNLAWPLRSFVLGAVLTAVLAMVIGFTPSERLTIGLGAETKVNPNEFGCVMAMGLFSAIYLYRQDPHRWMRLLYRILRDYDGLPS